MLSMSMMLSSSFPVSSRYFRRSSSGDLVAAGLVHHQDAAEVLAVSRREAQDPNEENVQVRRLHRELFVKVSVEVDGESIDILVGVTGSRPDPQAHLLRATIVPDPPEDDLGIGILTT